MFSPEKEDLHIPSREMKNLRCCVRQDYFSWNDSEKED
jgi:hypothetical protein